MAATLDLWISMALETPRVVVRTALETRPAGLAPEASLAAAWTVGRSKGWTGPARLPAAGPVPRMID